MATNLERKVRAMTAGAMATVISFIPAAGFSNVEAGLKYLENVSTTGITDRERAEHCVNAAREFTETLKKDSDNYEANLGMSKLSEKLNFDKDALSYAQKAVEINPTEDSWSALATAYINLRDFDYARRIVKEMLELNPESADAYRQLGYMHYLNKEYKKAIEQWDIGLKFKPDSYKTLNNIGSAYSKLGEHDNALKFTRAALKVNPYYPNAYVVLGLIFKELGRKQEAKEAFERAVELRPTAVNYREHLENIQK